MPAGQQLSHQAPSSANGASTAHELFALTDEQILEIEPEQEASGAAVEQPLLAVPARRADTTNAESAAQPNGSAASSQFTENTQQTTQAGVPVLSEPPPWLAAQMKDPWSGEEARELWNGVLQARSEAAAYRAAFATPEDARALKELYPGGVNEARESATRARLLEDIDRAYFGAPGGSAEQTSAARADLAQRMLREDPAAFREMVFASLRALEEAEKGSGASANASGLPRLAQVFAASRPDVGAQHAAPQLRAAPTDEAHVAAYTAFERAANDELERSVGTAITHTIQQALPNLGKGEGKATEGARNAVPLQERLGAAVRQDVEAALKGDRQLGEQIAQILSARRFDNETRAQVVRLIDDRARQLVPSAARRVINDWTQTTLAAHRGNASRGDTAGARREVEPVAAPSLPAGQAGASHGASSQAAQARPDAELHRNAKRSHARRLDYRKLSDEQILEL